MLERGNLGGNLATSGRKGFTRLRWMKKDRPLGDEQFVSHLEELTGLEVKRCKPGLKPEDQA